MRGQIYRDTDYYACRLLGIRVRVTLEHTVELPDELPETGGSPCVCLSTRIVHCSGAASCGWLHGELRARSACPYRVALGDGEQVH
jgi:hypothetical protein